MKKKKNISRKINISFQNVYLGTLIEVDDSHYTYLSNVVGEIIVRDEFFLPKSYEDTMFGSAGKSTGKRRFIEDIAAKLDRSDLTSELNINSNSSSFDKLYNLASKGYFVGENFKFECEQNINYNNKCEEMEK